MPRPSARNGARGSRRLRRRVLEIIWQSHRPLGAYAILDVLSGEGHSPAPPTVYRALEFLLMHGLVHRLSSLNAFIGCARPGHPGAGQFLLCIACGTAAELNDAAIERAIERSAAAEGFTSQVHTVEISASAPTAARPRTPARTRGPAGVQLRDSASRMTGLTMKHR